MPSIPQPTHCPHGREQLPDPVIYQPPLPGYSSPVHNLTGSQTSLSTTDNSYPTPADSGTYEAGLMMVSNFDTVESTTGTSIDSNHHPS